MLNTRVTHIVEVSVTTDHRVTGVVRESLNPQPLGAGRVQLCSILGVFSYTSLPAQRDGIWAN